MHEKNVILETIKKKEKKRPIVVKRERKMSNYNLMSRNLKEKLSSINLYEVTIKGISFRS